MAPKVRFFTRREWILIGLCALILSVSKSMGIYPILVPLRSKLSWSFSFLTYVFLIFTLTKSLGGILMGAISDRYGTRRTLIVGTVIFAISFALFSAGGHPGLIYIFGVPAAIGLAAFTVPILAFIQRSFPTRPGLATPYRLPLDSQADLGSALGSLDKKLLRLEGRSCHPRRGEPGLAFRACLFPWCRVEAGAGKPIDTGRFLPRQ